MNTLLALSASILPALLILMYVWKKDEKKEPVTKLIKAVLLGMAISIPIAFAEYFLRNALVGILGTYVTSCESINSFFVCAIPEESFKLLVLWLILRKNPYFDEHYDGIVYSVCVALGFVTFINFIGLFGSGFLIGANYGRALLSVPMHYACAILMGYYYSLSHYGKQSTKNAIFILLIPVMAHGVYDALVLNEIIRPIDGIVACVILTYFCIKMQNVAQSRLHNMIER